ncbi:helicase RecD/TraA family [Clostridium sp. CAG:264]|nr:helicase RecD/TraA family [Clostridium sp. CAG:264]
MIKEGYVEKVIYKNDDNGYAVFTVECEDGEDIFVGTLHGISEGIYISAEGEYVNHPQYDLQFKFTSYEIKMPDDMVSVERYLGSGIIKGVGEALAKRIVKKFKMDSLRIIEEEPERLAEVKGISERKAREIAVSYNEKKEMQDAIIFLTGYGISINLAVKIFNEYGQEMYKIIRSNPYKIAEDISGVGFKTADEIAERMGISSDSDFRIRAALLYTLLNASQLGHMYLPKQMLVAKTYSLLVDDNVPYNEELENEIGSQIIELQMAGKAIVKELDGAVIAVYAAANYYIELNSARILSDIDLDFTSEDRPLDKMLAQIEEVEKITLEEKQKLAIKNAVNNGVAVITGGPGTGKTTTINAMIKMFEKLNLELLLAAPTGRAAKRITEATGYTAQTIHRLLELSGGGIDEEGNSSTYTFARNSNNPLEADVIIIDEMSMVDSSLFYSLLQAIMPGTRLVLVGDSNQLPSVGPGNVLKDIIRSEVFSVTVLDKIFRQGENSDIITNAHLINAGKQLAINNKSRDFFYIPRQGSQDIIAELKHLILDSLPGFFQVDPMNIQVLTPMRKYELGVENLNKRLQEILNPPNRSIPEKEKNDVVFRKGDKVMQIKNNYKLEWKIMDAKGRFVKEEGVGVFNGDVGFVKEIDEFDQKIVVEYDDGRLVDYLYSQLDELEHAYAITIHKSQGSEYPVVVIPLLTGPAKLLNRNLLYTAVTRARKGVVIVGNIGLVKTMIDNIDEQKRYTTFAERLVELA